MAALQLHQFLGFRLHSIHYLMHIKKLCIVFNFWGCFFFDHAARPQGLGKKLKVNCYKITVKTSLG